MTWWDLRHVCDYCLLIMHVCDRWGVARTRRRQTWRLLSWPPVSCLASPPFFLWHFLVLLDTRYGDRHSLRLAMAAKPSTMHCCLWFQMIAKNVYNSISYLNCLPSQPVTVSTFLLLFISTTALFLLSQHRWWCMYRVTLNPTISKASRRAGGSYYS
jgi:hypothetical protein